MSARLSHLNSAGAASMVDVGGKPATSREALALGEVRIRPEVLELIGSGSLPKGDVLAAARLAGIMAAKNTGSLIPLCHPLFLEVVEVAFRLEAGRVVIRARAKTSGPTGVEMEALTAACVAGLTIYDMCKSADKEMTLGPFYLARKSGGKSGLYERAGTPEEPGSSGGDEASWL